MTAQRPMGPFRPRVILPPADGNLTEKLAQLARMTKKRPSEWWAHQIKQLLPLAEKAERQKLDYWFYGFLGGLAAGVIAGALLAS